MVDGSVSAGLVSRIVGLIGSAAIGWRAWLTGGTTVS
jgi:hypothetical protein